MNNEKKKKMFRNGNSSIMEADTRLVGIICLANLKMLFNLGVCQQFTLKRREVYLSTTHLASKEFNDSHIKNSSPLIALGTVDGAPAVWRNLKSGKRISTDGR
jgi:hypothetical protein